MKRILFLIAIVLTVALNSYGQRTAIDTVTNAETVYLDVMQGAEQVQILCTNISGTPAGTITLEGSIDGTTFSVLKEVVGKFDFFASASLTIADGATMLVRLPDSKDGFHYYRVKAVSTGTHVTQIDLIWSK